MLLLPLLLLGCEPIGPVPGQTPFSGADPRGELRVSLETLDFGQHSVIEDGPSQRSFEVSNVGDASLVVAGLHWVVPDEVFSSDGPALVELAPGERRTVTITFDPRTDGSYDAVLFPNGQARIDLRGDATAPVAEIYSDESAVPPDVYVGCEGVAELTLINGGREDLQVDDVALLGSADFRLEGEAPETLAPGRQVRFGARFTPSQGGAQSATFQVYTDDPASPVQSAPVSFLGVRGSLVTQEFEAIPPSTADLLFVVDTSSSTMSDTLASAQRAAERLFEELDAGQVDWRVAISTNSGVCRPTVDPYLHPGLYQHYSPSMPGDVLAYGLNPGVDAPARLLDQALEAVAESHSGGCFEDFIRDADQLHIILVTLSADDSDSSAGEALAQLRARVSEDGQLRVSAITGQGSATDCPDGGAPRTAARETDGLEADLCATSWTELFSRIAEVSIGVGERPVTLPLDTLPVTSTLEVSYRGRALSEWSLDTQANAILLDAHAEELPIGAPVTVTYMEAVPCE